MKQITKDWIAVLLILVLTISLVATISYFKNKQIPTGVKLTKSLPGSTGNIGGDGKILVSSPGNNLFGDASDCSPGTVYCGSQSCGTGCTTSICGPNRGWCDNYNSGGGHCKSSDPSWCCYDPGYVVCGNTNTCGPSSTWCNNFLNGDKSCNYNVGGNRCCNDAGWIYDYSHNLCCSPNYPFLWANSDGSYGCMYYAQSGTSDNYFTRLSDCNVKFYGSYPPSDSSFFLRDEKCSGTDRLLCSLSASYIWNFKDVGAVKGKCGVDCLSSSDCPGNKSIGNAYCDGLNLMKKFSLGTCGAGYKCVNSSENRVIEQCTTSCEDFSGDSRCRYCEEGAKDYYDCGEGYIANSWVKKNCEQGRWSDVFYTQEVGSGPCQCTDNSVCAPSITKSELYCSGKNVVQDWRDYGCADNKCASNDTTRIMKTCTYKCGEGKCQENWTAISLIILTIIGGLGASLFFILRKKRE